MILKLKYPLLLTILSFLFYSCEKEYSLEGDTPLNPAEFSFTGAPGPCASAVVTGTFETGTALGATNIVTIAVDVTTIGAYTITTDVSNGISFAGTGSFTTLGIQTVVLTGTGIPVATGTFPYTPGTSGCAFPVTISPASGGNTSVFTYNGAPGGCTSANPAGAYLVGTALNATNTITIQVDVTTIGTWTVSTPVVNGVSFSGTGSFTDRGAQSVTLTGSGTPVAEGIYTFTPTNGCSFPVTVLTGVALTDSLVCLVDGVPKSFNVSLVGEQLTVDTFDISGQSADAVPLQLGINLVRKPGISGGTYDKFSATNTQMYNISGFTDGTTTWFTGLAATTAGFSVTVTSYTGTRMDGTFSGTLYSDPVQGTGPIVITNGKFSIPY